MQYRKASSKAEKALTDTLARAARNDVTKKSAKQTVRIGVDKNTLRANIASLEAQGIKTSEDLLERARETVRRTNPNAPTKKNATQRSSSSGSDSSIVSNYYAISRAMALPSPQKEAAKKSFFGRLGQLVSSPFKGAKKEISRGVVANVAVNPLSRGAKIASQEILFRGKAGSQAEKDIAALVKNPTRSNLQNFVARQRAVYTDPDVKAYGLTGAALIGGASSKAVQLGIRGGASLGFGYKASEAIAKGSPAAAAEATLAGLAAFAPGGRSVRNLRENIFARRVRVKPSGEPFSASTKTTYVPYQKVLDISSGRPRTTVETISFKRQAPGYEVPRSRSIFEIATKERQLALRRGGADPFSLRKPRTFNEIITPLERARRSPSQTRLGEYGVKNPLRPETRYLLRYKEARTVSQAAKETPLLLKDFAPRPTPRPRQLLLGKKAQASLTFGKTYKNRPNPSAILPKDTTPFPKITRSPTRVSNTPRVLTLPSTVVSPKKGSLLEVEPITTPKDTTTSSFSSVLTSAKTQNLTKKDLLGRAERAREIDLLNVRAKQAGTTKLASAKKQTAKKVFFLATAQKLSQDRLSQQKLMTQKLGLDKNPLLPPTRKNKKTFSTEETEDFLGLGKTKKAKAFAVQIKREGKFFTVAKGLGRGAALDQLVTSLNKSLAATGRIVPTSGRAKNTRGTGAYARLKGSFRDYQVKKGVRQRLPGVTLIEKRSARLSTTSETSAIRKAKKKQQRWL